MSSKEDKTTSIEEGIKFNKVGKQLSESEHQATHNVLNTPKRKQAEVNKPYQDFTPFSESNPKQELKKDSSRLCKLYRNA